jgi:hypothetical protein
MVSLAISSAAQTSFVLNNVSLKINSIVEKDSIFCLNMVIINRRIDSIVIPFPNDIEFSIRRNNNDLFVAVGNNNPGGYMPIDKIALDRFIIIPPSGTYNFLLNVASAGLVLDNNKKLNICITFDYIDFSRLKKIESYGEMGYILFNDYLKLGYNLSICPVAINVKSE